MEDNKTTPADDLARIMETFACTDRRRASFGRPARKDGFAYATDGRIAVKVKMRDGEDGESNAFFRDQDLINCVASAVGNVIRANEKLANAAVSVSGLDGEFYHKALERANAAAESCHGNDYRYERHCCPCCGAELCYDTEDEELLDADSFEEERREAAVARICVSAVVDGKTMYFSARRIADVVWLGALRKAPLAEAFVCDGRCLLMRGDGWDAVMMPTRLEPREVNVIHSIEQSTKGEGK